MYIPYARTCPSLDTYYTFSMLVMKVAIPEENNILQYTYIFT